MLNEINYVIKTVKVFAETKDKTKETFYKFTEQIILFDKDK